MKLLRAAFDTVDFAVQGHLHALTSINLEAAKKQAAEDRSDVSIELGPGLLPVLVRPTGTKSGYTYVASTGDAGASYCLRPNTDPNGWNGFVSISALMLLNQGYEAAKAQAFDDLARMGFDVSAHSVNRMDFAIDVLAPDFELDVARFIAPAQATVRPHWSPERDRAVVGEAVQAVIQGRRFVSVMIGKLPARQVTVYDKSAAAKQLRQPYWFDAWRVDKDAQVFRTEFRFGRDRLKPLASRRDFASIEAALPDALRRAARDIRYADSDPCKLSNVSRAPLDPLWALVQDTVDELVAPDAPPALSARELAELRSMRALEALKQGCANLLNYAVLLGIEVDELLSEFPNLLKEAGHLYRQSIGEAKFRQKIEEVDRRFRVRYG